ncbi:MAG: NAD(P)-dependent oxidoreductase [Patescibacteria group bacterium]
MKIKVYDDIHLLTLLHSINDLEFDPEVTEENMEAIFVRSKDLKKMTLPKTLAAIGRAGSGVDNIPLDWCSRNGVAVFNAPGCNSNAVKEMVLAALVMSARPMLQAANALTKDPKNPEKLKKEFKGHELAEKNILILGMGAIGSRVANMCLALDMAVYAHDPFVDQQKFDPRIKFVANLDEAAKLHLNFITIHSALTDQNRKMVNRKFFHGSGVGIINFARAEFVDEQDLLDDLQTGRVRAYISDFVPKEIPIEEFLKTGRAIFFPHLGASTYEAETKATQMVGGRINDFFYYGICQGSVNFPNTNEDEVSVGCVRLLVSSFNQPGVTETIHKVILSAGLNINSVVNEGRADTGIVISRVDFHADSSDERLLKVREVIEAIEGVTRVRICDPESRY